MPDRTPQAHRLLVLAVLAAVLGLGACGSDNSNSDNLKKEGETLQKQGQQLQMDAAKTAKQVQSGTKSAEAAAKELTAKSKKLEQSAKGTASKAIDTAKGQENLPDSAKKALSDAQKQIKQQP